MRVSTVADDGSLTLRLRMPDCLAQEYGKHLVIENVRFAYGHGAGPGSPSIQCRLQSCRRQTR